MLMKDEIEETLEVAKKEATEAGLERGRALGLEQGQSVGRIESQRETSIALTKMGMSLENIAKAVNARVEQVKEWISDGGIVIENR